MRIGLGTRLALFTLSVAACGDPAISADFENAARETAPVMSTNFQQTSAVVSQDSYAIMPGHIRDEVYSILCDWEDKANCDVGIENVYHALADLDGVSADTVDGMAAGTVEIPFFGDLVEYDEKRRNPGVAWKVRGDTVSLLYAPTGQNGSSVYQAELNQVTGDLVVRIAGLWPGTGGSYGLRAEIEGNRNRHDFVLNIAKGDPTDSSGTFISFRGAGVSRGEGGRFLFQIASDNTTDGATQNGYHCVDAATMTDVAGNTTDTVHADCAASAAQVAGINEFTLADLPATAFDSTL